MQWLYFFVFSVLLSALHKIFRPRHLENSWFLSFVKERRNDVTYMKYRMGIKAADMVSWCGE